MEAMTNKQWKALLPKDKEVLKSLGIFDLVKPKEKKVSKNKALSALEPYVLKRTSTCRICKTISTSYFRMLPSTKGRFLSSIKIEQEDILSSDIIKENIEYYLGCSNCYIILKEKSKEELIRRIIKLSRG